MLAPFEYPKEYGRRQRCGCGQPKDISFRALRNLRLFWIIRTFAHLSSAILDEVLDEDTPKVVLANA
jgi:hypothetical protein